MRNDGGASTQAAEAIQPQSWSVKVQFSRQVQLPSDFADTQ